MSNTLTSGNEFATSHKIVFPLRETNGIAQNIVIKSIDFYFDQTHFKKGYVLTPSFQKNKEFENDLAKILQEEVLLTKMVTLNNQVIELNDLHITIPLKNIIRTEKVGGILSLNGLDPFMYVIRYEIN